MPGLGELVPDRELRDGWASSTAVAAEFQANAFHPWARLSEGQRAALHLLAVALSTPAGATGVLAIDEPEANLHPALLGRLCDRIERERPGLTPVYGTHNLPFALARPGATKVWVRGRSTSSGTGT